MAAPARGERDLQETLAPVSGTGARATARRRQSARHDEDTSGAINRHDLQHGRTLALLATLGQVQTSIDDLTATIRALERRVDNLADQVGRRSEPPRSSPAPRPSPRPSPLRSRRSEH